MSETIENSTEATELPNLDRAMKKYKDTLRSLSKNELIRQNAYLYARFTLANMALNDLSKEKAQLTEKITALESASKESHD